MYVCYRCHKAPRTAKNHKYCRPCHNAYMREWRKRNPLTPEQRRKDIARSYAGVYLRRGYIQRKLCEVCGEHAQMHHEDYSKPAQVRWLCRKHHMDIHRKAA